MAFLSGDAGFVRLCEQYNNISFVGHSNETLLRASDKAATKKVAAEQQISLMAGYTINNINNALLCADSIGYPIMLKISNGGGEAGMKPVYNEDELKRTSKTLNSGRHSELLIEKYIKTARHIEIQIIADRYGNIVMLGNRECSIQENNKKVLEECPIQKLSDGLLKKLYADSFKLAKAVNYIGIGMVEFLVDEAKNYFFMEMNTRIQVEHGITEMITGINLVQWQIKIAAGEKIPFTQEDVTFTGHAIECKIKAQSCGRINR